MSIVELNNIEFSYKSSSDIFRISELNIKPGERIFIHGPSGSGKSTLLNLVSGILSPKSGRLNVLDTDFTIVSSRKRDKVRGGHIGYIFQNFNLIPYLSAFENIELPIKSSKKRRTRVEDINSTIDIIAKKLDIQDILYKNVQELSVGQQQRVAVARAFIGSPELIIADEPTSSLDRNVTNQFMDLIFSEQEKKGFSLLFVSHDLELAKKFDRVISMEEISGVSKC